MHLGKRFWSVYAVLLFLAIAYAVHTITTPEKIVLPYNNPEDIAVYKRIDTMKNLSDHQKLVYKQQNVILRKKVERLIKKWYIKFGLESTFDNVAQNIVLLASKNMPDKIIKDNLNKPAVYSQTFVTDIDGFSYRINHLQSVSISIVHKTVMVDSNKILYKYYYCRHEAGIDKPVAQINMLFDKCISQSRCTNIKVFDTLEMDRVYVKPRSMEYELNQ